MRKPMTLVSSSSTAWSLEVPSDTSSDEEANQQVPENGGTCLLVVNKMEPQILCNANSNNKLKLQVFFGTFSGEPEPEVPSDTADSAAAFSPPMPPSAPISHSTVLGPVALLVLKTEVIIILSSDEEGSGRDPANNFRKLLLISSL